MSLSQLTISHIRYVTKKDVLFLNNKEIITNSRFIVETFVMT